MTKHLSEESWNLQQNLWNMIRLEKEEEIIICFKVYKSGFSKFRGNFQKYEEKKSQILRNDSETQICHMLLIQIISL